MNVRSLAVVMTVVVPVLLRGAQVTQTIQTTQPAPAVTSATAGSLQFEVASVKPNKSGDNRVMIGIQPGGRYTASNVPLRQLITQAYALQAAQLIGGPDWIRTERFDISAKAPDGVLPPPGAPPAPAGFQTNGPGASPTPMQQMLRALLADRFKLVVHNETRELPVYALMTAKADKSLGPKMTPSTTDCAAMAAAARGRVGGPPAPGPGSNEPMVCGMRIGPGVLSAGDTTMAQLAQSLSGTAQRIVLDRTGLTGRYNLNLSWTPEQMPQAPPAVSPNAPPLPAVDPGGASIFTALQEQLGLKLESVREPIPVVVIDSVEPPIPD